MDADPAGPAAAAAAAASRPAGGSVAGGQDQVEYVVLDISNAPGEIREVGRVKVGKNEGREDAVAAAIEQSEDLKARAAEKELALLPIAARLYKAVKVKLETVPATTQLRVRS